MVLMSNRSKGSNQKELDAYVHMLVSVFCRSVNRLRKVGISGSPSERASCSCYGRPFQQGLLVKNGMTRGQKQALCRACGRSIALNTGTAYFELDAASALFDTAIRALAEGNSLRATGRIVQIDKDTACAWLHRAAVQCRLVMLYLWQGLSVRACHFDEFGSAV